MPKLLRASFVFSCCLGIVLGSAVDSQAESFVRQIQPQPSEDTTRGLEYGFGVATGYSRIGEGGATNRYATLRLLPEIYYRNLGIGLLATLRVNPRRGGFREEDFDDVRDYLALVYFLEYGTGEDEDQYGRFGSIEETSLSYGLFVDGYTNAHRLDDPMRGFTGTYTTSRFRVEALYADFASPSVFGVHTAYLPLGTAEDSSLPQVTLGVGLAGDFDDEGALVNPSDPGEPFLIGPASPEEQNVPRGVDDGTLVMLGVDAGARWLDTETVSMLSFVEAAKIFDYGIGASLGVQGAARVDRLRLRARYAQRILGKEFLPNYFDPSYEAERLREVSMSTRQGSDLPAVDTRRNDLAGRQQVGTGYNVQVHAEYEDVFDTTVGYETIWGEPNTGRFNFDFELRTAQFPVSIRMGYHRFDMTSLGDIFSLSGENVLYRFGVAYEILSPLRIGVEARQHFETVYRDGRTIGQRKQTRIEPMIHFVLRL